MFTKVPGIKKNNKVIIYAISTCLWCKRTKKLLEDNKVEYEYVDVDLCNNEHREKIRADILKRGGRLSYPTLIINDNIL